MGAQATIASSDFAAACTDLIDQIAAGSLERLVITRDGRPVAVLESAVDDAGSGDRFDKLFGCLREDTVMVEDVDLTAPVQHGEASSSRGMLHW